ncbi:hypothetical protein WH14_02775 [Streptococcus dysgalactiae subsp. equisimilis]|nr:hypothetical protein WH14_02775 [Streptococcus dysgalactiae subsp. equisimilis]
MKELEKIMEEIEKETCKIEKAQNRKKLLNQKKNQLKEKLRHKEKFKRAECLKPLKEKLQVGKKIQIMI